VRALGWGNVSLFGVARVKSLADWPLQASLPAAAGTAPFDPSTTWTIVAGGDVMFDRGVYKVVKLEGKGVDYPFFRRDRHDHQPLLLLIVGLGDAPHQD